MAVAGPAAASPKRRAAAVAFSIFAIFLGGGTVFGFESLLPVLRSEGVFSSLCRNSTAPVPAAVNCTERDLRFNLLYTVASSSANFLTLAAGPIIDATSPRFGGTLGFALLGVGFGVLAIVQDTAVFAGLLLVAMGAPFIMLSALFAEQFALNQASLVIMALVAALNASPAVFLFVGLFYRICGNATVVLTGFAGLCGVSMPFAWLLYHRRGELSGTTETALLRVNDPGRESPSSPLLAVVPSRTDSQSVSSRSNTATGWSLQRPEWLRGPGLAIVLGEGLFLASLSLAANFYLGSLDTQLRWKAREAGGGDIEVYVDKFNWILPLCCAMSVLVLGPLATLADRLEADGMLHLAAMVFVVIPLVLETFAPLEVHPGTPAPLASVHRERYCASFRFSVRGWGAAASASLFTGADRALPGLQDQWIAFPFVALGFTAPWAVAPEAVRRWYPVAYRGTILGGIIAFTAAIGLLTYVSHRAGLSLPAVRLPSPHPKPSALQVPPHLHGSPRRQR